MALAFPEPFEPPPGRSSVLLSEGAWVLYLAALGPCLLQPVGMALGIISVVRSRRRQLGSGHPLAWIAIAVAGATFLCIGCSNVVMLPLSVPAGWFS